MTAFVLMKVLITEGVPANRLSSLTEGLYAGFTELSAPAQSRSS
jgi:hypothetical protein